MAAAVMTKSATFAKKLKPHRFESYSVVGQAKNLKPTIKEPTLWDKFMAIWNYDTKTAY